MDEPMVDTGLDLVVHGKSIFETVDTLQSNGITVGICIPAEPEQAKLAHQLRAEWVQIHAGKLRAATSADAQNRELGHLIDTVKIARKLRLRVAVGNGLDYSLIKLFRGLEEIDEFSIGQSLIARALLKGLDIAIRDMIETTRSL
jgi:pyridoxine 5-phosphate synthase